MRWSPPRPEAARVQHRGPIGFEVRVVEPTTQDDGIVARLQAQTSIPIKVIADVGRLVDPMLQRLDLNRANPGCRQAPTPTPAHCRSPSTAGTPQSHDTVPLPRE